MKSLRASVVLEMVFELFENGFFTEGGIMAKLEVSRSTFFRCLSDVRCYLQEQRPFMEIVYEAQTCQYRLTEIKSL